MFIELVFVILATPNKPVVHTAEQAYSNGGKYLETKKGKVPIKQVTSYRKCKNIKEIKVTDNIVYKAHRREVWVGSNVSLKIEYKFFPENLCKIKIGKYWHYVQSDFGCSTLMEKINESCKGIK